MATVACILAFAASVAWCARQLVRSPRPASALLPVPTLVASWVLLMTMRAPTPGRALVAFTLADLAVLVLSVLGVVRLLGGFEQPLPDADDDEEDDGAVDPQPPPPRRPGGARRPRGPSGSRPSARGSGSRGSSRSSSGRSAPARS